MKQELIELLETLNESELEYLYEFITNLFGTVGSNALLLQITYQISHHFLIFLT